MMRRLRRATLLVAFVVLTSAATAYAECAWVLWEQTTSTATQQITESWAISEAYESRGACAVDRLEAVARFRARAVPEGTKNEVSGFTMTTYFLDGSGARRGWKSTQVWCLPAGTDPRPRYKE